MKQIVEEAVTRKFIHADSTSITSLCGKRFVAILGNICFQTVIKYINLYRISKQKVLQNPVTIPRAEIVYDLPTSVSHISVHLGL